MPKGKLTVELKDPSPAKEEKDGKWSTSFSRSPCEFYIKYILVKEEEISNKQLILRLHRQRVILPPDEEEYIESLRLELDDEPDTFVPDNLRHGPSQEYLHRHGLWTIWHSDRAMDDARKMFENRVMRSAMNALTVCSYPPPHIISLLSYKYGITCFEAMISDYRHYFWNTSILEYDEKAQLYADVRTSSPAARAFTSRGSRAGQREVLQDLDFPVSQPNDDMMDDLMRRLISDRGTHREGFSVGDAKALAALAQAIGNHDSVDMQGVLTAQQMLARFSATTAVSPGELVDPKYQLKPMQGRSLKLLEGGKTDEENGDRRSSG